MSYKSYIAGDEAPFDIGGNYGREHFGKSKARCCGFGG